MSEMRVIRKAKYWPSKYKLPPVFPVVLNEGAGVIHDFTRTFPLVGNRFYKDGEVYSVELKTYSGCFDFINILSGKKDPAMSSPYSAFKLLLENTHVHTDSFNLLFKHVMSDGRQRFDINIHRGFANLKTIKNNHSLNYTELDLTNRYTYRRHLPVIGDIDCWVGYTCVLTSLRGGFTGICTIVDIDVCGTPIVDCDILFGNKANNKGKIYPLFKRNVENENI